MSLFEKPIVNVVRVSANPGKEEEVKAMILTSAGRALAAPGNTGFQLYVSQSDPADFLIVEHWNSRAEHMKHEKDPAMPQMMQKVKEGNLIKSGPDDSDWTQVV